MYSTVQELLSKKNAPLTKPNFEEAYLNFASFFQEEENKSQNLCLYLSLNRYKGEMSGFLIKDRYKEYSERMKSEIARIK